MKKLALLLISTILFLFSCTSETKKKEANPVFHSETTEIILLYEDQPYPYTLDGEDIGFPYNDENTNIGFIASADTLKLELKEGKNVIVDFIINKKDTLTTLLKMGVKPVTYSKTYKQKNQGSYIATNPEVHELVNIMVALSKIGRLDSNMVYMETPYYQDVMNHFEPYANHPVIDSLNNNITEVFGESSYTYYYNIRMNANMYSFDDNNNIVNNGPYQNLGFNSESYLDELLPLVNDFAEKSNFRKFQQAHQKYQDSLVQTYYNRVDLKKMWSWIETKFPERYNGYKVFFSPLVNGAHAAQRFNDNNYKESIMFVDAPTFSRDDTRTIEEKEAILARIVFTEIDHNYVNPVTDTFPEISNLLEPLACWNNASQGYGGSYLTFNEYMTWAVFSLYLKDHFDSEIFEKRNLAEVKKMEKGRGFIKFGAFNDFVLNWHEQNPNTSFTELYPPAIAWFKAQNCTIND